MDGESDTYTHFRPYEEKTANISSVGLVGQKKYGKGNLIGDDSIQCVFRYTRTCSRLLACTSAKGWHMLKWLRTREPQQR